MTAKTKSERLRRLLSHGYFAPELPPCFVSHDLAKYRKSILDGIDAMPPVKGKPAFYNYISEPSWFYFPRFGKDDRRHGVPNPIAYLLLSRAVADNYIRLRTAAKNSGISSSPPIFDWNGPRALVRPSIDLRDDFRVDLSSRREEYVSADIRAFFHSIYTHAIPWAIHGKAFAKRNRGPQHFGNLIDLLCRNGQDGQTIGLPVGPDCSRLIAEVLASAIDADLRAKVGTGPRDASRYIDDYTISSGADHSGKNLIAALRQAAAQYELELNNDKSAVVPTSSRQDNGWKQEVRSYVPRGASDDAEFQHFFYRVGRICDAHPDTNIEKYAFQNARAAFVSASNWPKVQSHLIAAYRRNASLVAFLVEITLLRQAERKDVEKSKLTEFLEHRLPVLARENRTGEIIWFLFLAVRLRIPLSRASVEPLTEIDNSMVALLTTLCVKLRLVGGTINFTNWNDALSRDGLRSGMWLYAYESVGLGINPEKSTEFIEADPYFALLHAKKIRFLSIATGFTSINATLRSLRGDNVRLQRVHDDFFDDFTFELEELDDVSDYEIEDETY
ncbi:MAG: RNA-directed DNA polymerase [Alphaproteobacteria bacterium]|nr:RNA-directed DNA polymerase [Rhizobiaceae bacterium]MBU3959910.1 RNA-directed DNA polymerase [Alphaproteobacteria bacterium]MBU4050778.1 RNA-directed DNA polymerase [Alphaproteobacteria bacterium]MBU4089565.1 RNA-directed DNA polymerase [Alphaproteobacteria bacterium]MBU4155499.1 RNA-directed DNA polymerase [Alphaproteobacteria bacterium]